MTLPSKFKASEHLAKETGKKSSLLNKILTFPAGKWNNYLIWRIVHSIDDVVVNVHCFNFFSAFTYSLLFFRYWAVAVPCYLCMLWLLAYPAWFGYIHLCTAHLDSIDLITGKKKIIVINLIKFFCEEWMWTVMLCCHAVKVTDTDRESWVCGSLLIRPFLLESWQF